MDVARLVGGDETVLVNRGDLIARLIVQASRQSGVSVVYTEFFDYGGDEIYFRHDHSLVGKTYGDALFAYESCAVIGIRTGGSVTINPNPATVIGVNDEIVALAEDDAALEHAPAMTASIDGAAIVDLQPVPPGPHRALLLGWNNRCPIVVRELAKYGAGLAPDGCGRSGRCA
jgi:hypothetical protein